MLPNWLILSGNWLNLKTVWFSIFSLVPILGPFGSHIGSHIGSHVGCDIGSHIGSHIGSEETHTWSLPYFTFFISQCLIVLTPRIDSSLNIPECVDPHHPFPFSLVQPIDGYNPSKYGNFLVLIHPSTQSVGESLCTLCCTDSNVA